MPTPKGKNILIVDDNSDINNLFKIYLEYEGYKIDTYTDPIEALYYFKKDKYDLVLLDLKMPQIDGITMYQGLKKIDDKIIICLITADISYIQNLKERIPHIEKYVIHKPILLRNLKNKINELVSEKSNYTDKNNNNNSSSIIVSSSLF
jgi:DNA-binding response OmpR family regulator